jgi:hypothetical protein
VTLDLLTRSLLRITSLGSVVTDAEGNFSAVVDLPVASPVAASIDVTDGIGSEVLAPFLVEEPQAEVTTFSGVAHGVGLAPGRGAVEVVGTFSFAGPIDIGSRDARVSVIALLDEVVGRGDSVLGLPLTLVADPSNRPTSGRFKTARGSAPVAEMALRARGRGEFTFRLTLAGATIAPPRGCSRVGLTTAFIVADGRNRPVTVAPAQPWQCFGGGNRYLTTP